MIQFNKEVETLIERVARKMESSEKEWHIETLSSGLSHKLKALSGLCHQARELDTLDQDQILGLGYLLEDLAHEAQRCVTILRPGKPKAMDK